MAGLEKRAVDAARAALAASQSVSPLDVFCGIGWLTQNHLDHWRRGRADHLEPLLAVRPENLVTVLDALSRWAQENGLQPTEASYVDATRDRRPLRFIGGDEAVELVFRTHWISAELPPARRERVIERQNRPPDLLVIIPSRDWECAGCGGTGDFLMMDDAGPLCMTCVDLDHLVFLPAGDAALTRRARKASALNAVVVRWSRSRKHYERQGLLVEEAALEQAEASCLADSDARGRQRERARVRREERDVDLVARMAQEILALFPGCPAARAEAIAAHTGVRGSGRLGRSAAGQVLDEQALMAAVVASVRHVDTSYDELLMSGVDRTDARARMRPAVDAVLNRWRVAEELEHEQCLNVSVDGDSPSSTAIRFGGDGSGE